MPDFCLNCCRVISVIVQCEVTIEELKSKMFAPKYLFMHVTDLLDHVNEKTDLSELKVELQFDRKLWFSHQLKLTG